MWDFCGTERSSLSQHQNDFFSPSVSLCSYVNSNEMGGIYCYSNDGQSVSYCPILLPIASCHSDSDVSLSACSCLVSPRLPTLLRLDQRAATLEDLFHILQPSLAFGFFQLSFWSCLLRTGKPDCGCWMDGCQRRQKCCRRSSITGRRLSH